MFDPKVLKSPAFEDARGAFTKLFNGEELPDFHIGQVNYVQNFKRGTFRGLHMQKAPYQEAKRFCLIKGAMQLVYLDLRKNSPTYGISGSKTLNTPGQSALLSKGFATGYLVLENQTEVIYFSDNKYHPEYEEGLRWDDPLMKINWEILPLSVSEKDQTWKDYQL